MSRALRRTESSDRTALPASAGVGVLLLVFVAVRFGIGHLGDALRDAGLLGLRPAVALAYGSVATAALAAGFAVYAAERDAWPDRLDWIEAALAVGALAIVATYVVLGGVEDAPAATEVVLPAAYSLALGVVALWFARTRDLSISLRVPTGHDWVTIGGAVAVVTVAVFAVTAAATVVGWPNGPFAGFVYGSVPAASTVVLTTVVPSVIWAVGTALLFNGAAQAAFRRRHGAVAAVGAVTLLAFLTDWLLAVVPSVVAPVTGAIPGPLAALAALCVGVAVVAVLASTIGGHWARSDGPTSEGGGRGATGRPALVAAGAGAAGGAAIALAGTALIGGTPAVPAVGYAVAVAAAALVVERTQSVWAAVAAYAAYDIAVELAVRVALSTTGADAPLAVLAAIPV